MAITVFGKSFEKAINEAVHEAQGSLQPNDNLQVTQRIRNFEESIEENNILLNKKLDQAFSRVERFMGEKNYNEAIKEVGRIIQLILKSMEFTIVVGAKKFGVIDRFTSSTPQEIIEKLSNDINKIGADIVKQLKEEQAALDAKNAEHSAKLQREGKDKALDGILESFKSKNTRDRN